MDFFEVINKRYSVRSYKSDPIKKEIIDKILEAAKIAPTAANKQAFKIVLINTKGREEELKKIYNKEWFVEAPFIIGVVMEPAKAWIRNDGKNYSDVDAAIIMDHIILAATELGIGTCWIGNFDVNVSREILKFDKNLEPVAFTPLGYPADTALVKKRKSLNEILITY